MDCSCSLTEETWLKSAKKDGWRICVKCSRIRSNKSTKRYYKKKRAEDNDFDRARHLKANYNITIDEYDKMLEKQNGVCAICDKKEMRKNQFGVKRLAVDHNHITGNVRGLLCSKCNCAIGALGGDECGSKLLIKAMNYILVGS